MADRAEKTIPLHAQDEPEEFMEVGGTLSDDEVQAPEPNVESMETPETPESMAAADEEHTVLVERKMLQGARDTARSALFLGIVILVAVVVLFAYGQNAIVSLRSQVMAQQSVTERIAGVDQRVGLVEARMGELENLPAAMKKAYVQNSIQEMLVRTQALSGQAGDEATEQQLQALTKQLEEIAAGMQ